MGGRQRGLHGCAARRRARLECSVAPRGTASRGGSGAPCPHGNGRMTAWRILPRTCWSSASPRCCRRRSAGAVAMTVAVRTPTRSPRARRRSTVARPAATPTLAALAALLDTPLLPLDASCGLPEPLAVARIDETACIGCALCIAACPVDAIVGAPKLMHTVLADRCTGCALCLPPCPVDCIALPPAGRAWTRADADRARQHFAAHTARADRHVTRRGAASGPPQPTPGGASARTVRQAAIAAALARARARRGAKSPSGTGA